MAEIQLAFSLPIQCDELRKILPHRYPFLLVDRVLEITGGSIENRVGRTVKAIKNVSFNEPQFTGHFPDRSIMPGVLMIEALAQTAAVCAYLPTKHGKETAFFIVGVDDARFRRPVVPGDQLELVVRCIKDRGPIVSFECQALCEGHLVVEANIMAKIG